MRIARSKEEEDITWDSVESYEKDSLESLREP
jgi:hypothetical protein